MNQNYYLEDRLLNTEAGHAAGPRNRRTDSDFRHEHQDSRAEEKGGLNPLALGLRCWKLEVDCLKFGSRAANKTPSVSRTASLELRHGQVASCPSH